MSDSKLKVIVAGTPEFAAVSLKRLIHEQNNLNIKIIAVYTQPDRKAGRGQKLTASPVKKIALQHNIPIEQPETFRKSSEVGIVAREKLASYNPDLMIVAAYGLILPLGVLNIPRLGCINIHGSLLPRWRGAAPIHRAILADDKKTGITIMQMDHGLDTGDMLYKISCDIQETDTSATLHDKLANLGSEALITVLKNIESYQENATKQDDNSANYAEKLNKSEGKINWNHTAKDICRQIRGMHPYPSTYCFLNGDRIKIIAATPDNTIHTTAEVGTITSIEKESINITCGHGSVIKLTELQFSGGKPLNAEQIYTGKKLTLGDKFDV